MRRTKDEANETIRKLIDVARRHFADHGYEKAGLEQIAIDADVTRGALYHHFRNKKNLFHAVLAAVQQEVGERVEEEASRRDDLMEQLLQGSRAFLLAAVEPKNKRILLVEGPAVLGWDVWRELDEQNSLRHLKEQLQIMKEQGVLGDVSVDSLAHFVSGALNESALWMAQLEDTSKAMEETMSMLTLLLERAR
ncbi:TetR family transcriptional regulator [Paenibacillus sp. GSMTC-2017]|uniref:TetR/AcrR family transcriptional regulator n=1 Tax=Paenibacillus sp. GSMTC-2017 TaxID=2794350 RepID=UPI0018D92E36|nr:TetR family transcriptional regulator [Paenibacillus sp. GSMTC-2017]MBH5318284.1 TetR family transcriptional regulator [Paenibacillus sp. GSMTC-2017]